MKYNLTENGRGVYGDETNSILIVQKIYKLKERIQKNNKTKVRNAAKGMNKKVPFEIEWHCQLRHSLWEGQLLRLPQLQLEEFCAQKPRTTEV